MQAKVVARVLADQIHLPERQIMEADVQSFYSKLKKYGLPIRYAHNQGDAMPAELDQWAYNDELTQWAGPDLEEPPQWRRDLHNKLQDSIFGRPETFRDQWTDVETAAFTEAAAMCHDLWLQHLATRDVGKSIGAEIRLRNSAHSNKVQTKEPQLVQNGSSRGV